MPGIFTTGQDVSLVTTTPNGNLTVPNLTDFSAKPMYSDLKSRPLGGKPLYDVIPDGWDLSFTADRIDSTLEDYFAAAEAGYYTSSNSQYQATVRQTVTNPDGSVSVYRFTGVALKLTSAGDYSGDKKTVQTFTGRASTRVKVS